MIRLIIVTLAMLFAMPAQADIFTYACRLKGRSVPVRIDTTANTLRWLGKVYKIKEQPNCAKYGWHAERDDDAFDFCTATQGVAGFENGGPPKADCLQKN